MLLFSGVSMLPTAQAPGSVEGLTAITGVRVGHRTIVAGVRTADAGALADARELLRGRAPLGTRGGENTTIGVVATNATLTKAQLGIVARMAHDGLARAVRPAHTPSDGDTIFVLSTSQVEEGVSLLRIGALAADVTAEAILRAVRAATSLPGYPSVSDLQGGPR